MANTMADRGHSKQVLVALTVVGVFGYFAGYFTGYLAARNKKVCPACTNIGKAGEERKSFFREEITIRPRMLGRMRERDSNGKLNIHKSELTEQSCVTADEFLQHASASALWRSPV